LASNVTSRRFLQHPKHEFEIVLVAEGMQIDRSPQNSKAESPRFEIRQPGSKVTLESFRHSQKQYAEIVSVDEGMQID
jgi:hypothetical protein